MTGVATNLSADGIATFLAGNLAKLSFCTRGDACRYDLSQGHTDMQQGKVGSGGVIYQRKAHGAICNTNSHEPSARNDQCCDGTSVCSRVRQLCQ
ncbi:hypothetical protein CHELA40_40154 [Chelatococcus asaccharovorans]|nr:hypothetical protein CHELA17_50039 [Chelatococcus asaccharovorans]CAH1690045.1 hypothetical protein CHELA40_40154 [Chelatococcus asaccharovorans]